MSASPWGLLGIARTSDDGEIRRAYARALKAIDVDQDPGAFIALRQAFDAARMHAAQASAHLPEPVLAGDGPETEPHAESSAQEPDPEPELEARPGWVEDVEAIQALIFGDQTREAIFAEVGLRAERLLNGREMEQIDHAARVEQWAVQVILSGIPRSNALLLPALQRFDWIQRYQKWDCHPAIRAVVSRYMDCQLVNDLNDGKSIYAMPFRLIQRSTKPRGSQVALVERFLAMVRSEYPTVLQELPPQSLEAWDALIARRNNALPARFGQARRIYWTKFVRFARRYKLDLVGQVLFFTVATLLGLGLVVATHGLALIFLVPALVNANKK